MKACLHNNHCSVHYRCFLILILSDPIWSICFIYITLALFIFLLLERLSMTFTPNGKRQKWNVCRLSSVVCTVEGNNLYLQWIVGDVIPFFVSIYGLEEKNSKSEVIFAVCRLPLTSCLTSVLANCRCLVNKGRRPFLEGSEFLHAESHSKISNLMITEFSS